MKRLIILASSMTMIFAHGGRTDKYGCHTNRKTGEYHCHNAKTPKPKVKEQKKCNASLRCYEMTTCEEAMFQYQTCGNGKLDRDKDGIPCESLCGN